MALYSYVLRFDFGDAPNPYGGVCTLTICKPAIRRTAQVGDWIIGTGSKHSPVGDISDYLVYAMRVSEKLTMTEYDLRCRKELTIKMPGHRSHRKQRENLAGDSLYDFRQPSGPRHRGGHMHFEPEMQARDWSGIYALLSNEFYYFGSEPRAMPLHLHSLIKRGQNHYRKTSYDEIAAFEAWLKQEGFESNRIYADPQAPVWEKYGFHQNRIASYTNKKDCS